LDLLYEARDVEQFVTNQTKIDDWFDAKTKGLTDVAKVELKKALGNLIQKYCFKSRLEEIVDIMF
jgi:type I restriction enzyme R subunit